MNRGTWMSQSKLRHARRILRQCEDLDVREEGLACLRNAKPEYLCNIIHTDHPDRAQAVEFLEKNS